MAVDVVALWFASATSLACWAAFLAALNGVVRRSDCRPDEVYAGRDTKPSRGYATYESSCDNPGSWCAAMSYTREKGSRILSMLPKGMSRKRTGVD